MSLITCPECGNRVSSLAESCPSCGWPVTMGNQADETPALHGHTDEHAELEAPSSGGVLQDSTSDQSSINDHSPTTQSEKHPHQKDDLSAERTSVIKTIVKIILATFLALGLLASLFVLGVFDEYLPNRTPRQRFDFDRFAPPAARRANDQAPEEVSFDLFHANPNSFPHLVKVRGRLKTYNRTAFLQPENSFGSRTLLLLDFDDLTATRAAEFLALNGSVVSVTGRGSFGGMDVESFSPINGATETDSSDPVDEGQPAAPPVPAEGTDCGSEHARDRVVQGAIDWSSWSCRNQDNVAPQVWGSCLAVSAYSQSNRGCSGEARCCPPNRGAAILSYEHLKDLYPTVCGRPAAAAASRFSGWDQYRCREPEAWRPDQCLAREEYSGIAGTGCVAGMLCCPRAEP